MEENCGGLGQYFPYAFRKIFPGERTVGFVYDLYNTDVF